MCVFAYDITTSLLVTLAKECKPSPGEQTTMRRLHRIALHCRKEEKEEEIMNKKKTCKMPNTKTGFRKSDCHVVFRSYLSTAKLCTISEPQSSSSSNSSATLTISLDEKYAPKRVVRNFCPPFMLCCGFFNFIFDWFESALLSNVQSYRIDHLPIGWLMLQA